MPEKERDTISLCARYICHATHASLARRCRTAETFRGPLQGRVAQKMLFPTRRFCSWKEQQHGFSATSESRRLDGGRLIRAVMEERVGGMGTFIEELGVRIAAELRYTAAVLGLYREREREYRRELDVARLRCDNQRAGELEAYLTSFRSEVARIASKERSARIRLRLLHREEGFPNQPFRAGLPDDLDSETDIGGWKQHCRSTVNRARARRYRPSDCRSIP